MERSSVHGRFKGVVVAALLLIAGVWVVPSHSDARRSLRIYKDGVFQGRCDSLSFGSNLTATKNGNRQCDIDASCSCTGQPISTTVDYFDDFIWGANAYPDQLGGISSDLGWGSYATNCAGGFCLGTSCDWSNAADYSGAVSADDFNRPGIFAVRVANEANKGCALTKAYSGANSDPRAFYGLTQHTNWKMIWAGKLESLTNDIFLMGFTSEYTHSTCPSNSLTCITSSFSPNEFIGIRYEASASSKFQCYSCTGGTCSGTDITAVSPAAGTWYKFTLDMSSTNLRCQIDATTAVTKSTNLPGAVAQTWVFGVYTKAATSVRLFLDYVWYHQTNLSR